MVEPLSKIRGVNPKTLGIKLSTRSTNSPLFIARTCKLIKLNELSLIDEWFWRYSLLYYESIIIDSIIGIFGKPIIQLLLVE